MTIVRDCMFRNVATLSPSGTVMEAIHHLVGQAPGFAVILENLVVVGVVTEYDLLRWLVQGRDPKTTRIGDMSYSSPRTVQENTPCQELLQIYNQNRFRRFPVLNDDGLLSGGIMEKQILSSLPRSNLLAHYRVSDVTTPAPVISLPMGFQEAARVMVKQHRGCLLVVENEQLVGIISERDMLRFRTQPEWSVNASIATCMSRHPIVIAPERDLLFATDLFQRQGHRRLPVVDGRGKLVGLLTQTDILKQTVHSARSHRAILNPEDIAEPALWFESHGAHRLLALNEKGAKALSLDPTIWVGQPVAPLAADPDVWPAIATLLHNCGSLGPIRLPLRTGEGEPMCVSCRFSLIPTPTGENRIFWIIGEMENLATPCR